jgi:cell division transport system ATP-binding protein
MILIDGVSKKYHRHLSPVLDEVSLHVKPGEFVFLVGKSGAGKSTLMRMLTREDMPDSGKIFVGGIDYDDLRHKHIPHLRRRIGVVFQDYKLLPSRTVYENVAFALEVVGVSGREIKKIVPRVIELVGLEGKEGHFPDQLSGGERQRVAIARSVARQPKILIADEPTGNLDPDTGREIMALLTKINELGTTVLVTTHDAKIVDEMGKRVVTLKKGKVIGDQKEGGKYMIDRDGDGIAAVGERLIIRNGKGIPVRRKVVRGAAGKRALNAETEAVEKLKKAKMKQGKKK